jgi:hypothetical protein
MAMGPNALISEKHVVHMVDGFSPFISAVKMVEILEDSDNVTYSGQWGVLSLSIVAMTACLTAKT